MIELQPGESYAMDTSWWPTRADSQMRGVTSAGVILSPLTNRGSLGEAAITRLDRE